MRREWKCEFTGSFGRFVRFEQWQWMEWQSRKNARVVRSGTSVCLCLVYMCFPLSLQIEWFSLLCGRFVVSFVRNSNRKVNKNKEQLISKRGCGVYWFLSGIWNFLVWECFLFPKSFGFLLLSNAVQGWRKVDSLSSCCILVYQF